MAAGEYELALEAFTRAAGRHGLTGEILTSDAFATGPEQSATSTTAPKIAPATLIEVTDPETGIVETVGVVGATTPILGTISSPGGVDTIGTDQNDMAALATASQRQAALYHHWDHKQYVFIFGFISRIFDTTGIGLIPALKIITDGQPANFLDDGVIIEARLGPLGFIGDFDHTKPANDVTYRDIRETLPNGDPNPAFGRFSIPPAMPQGWEFG